MNSNLPNLGSTLSVYIDTEFTDFVKQDLISIGLAASNGDEFYGENYDFIRAWSSEWVREHVYSLLDLTHKRDSRCYPRTMLSAKVWQWIDDLPCDFIVVMIDYHSDYDLLLDLFGDEKHPKIIEVKNIDHIIFQQCNSQVPLLNASINEFEQRVRSAKTKFNLYFMDYFYRTKEIQHHALSDAKANREAFEKLAKEFAFYF